MQRLHLSRDRPPKQVFEAGEIPIHRGQVLNRLIKMVVIHNESFGLKSMAIFDIDFRAHQGGTHHLCQAHGERVRHPALYPSHFGGETYERLESHGKSGNCSQY